MKGFCLHFLNIINVFHLILFATYRSHSLVCAFPSKLFGEACYLFGSFCNAFGTGNEIPLAASPFPSHQLWQPAHQDCHFLSSYNNVIVLAWPLPHLLVESMCSHLKITFIVSFWDFINGDKQCFRIFNLYCAGTADQHSYIMGVCGQTSVPELTDWWFTWVYTHHNPKE